MNNNNSNIDAQFFDMVKLTWQEIFGRELNLTQAEFEQKYTKDLRLPVKHKSSFSEEDVYMVYPKKKTITPQEVAQQSQDYGFMLEKQGINNINELFEKVKRVSFFAGNYAENSDNVFKSDQVFSSSNIYLSANVFTSRRIGYSYGIHDCEMVFASESGKNNNYCLRVFDSSALTNCFEVYNASKCVNSQFIHYCTDLRDCLFCFSISSKQYCIANMQYTKEEYEKIRKMILDYLHEKHDLQIGDV